MTESVTQSNSVLARSIGTELLASQYEFLFNMTSQLLATQSLEERLQLALDAIRIDLGYSQAGIALIDQYNASLRMRMAVGFPDNEAVEHIQMPIDSSAPYVAIVHEGRPVWITRQGGEFAFTFLKGIGCATDLLALPLFGGQWKPERPGKPAAGQTYWMPETMCLGVLYIGAEREATSEATFSFLARIAERIGFIIGSGVQVERMGLTINKLQRERQWVESIMKSVADPIVLTNLDNEILLQNRRAEELFSGSENASEGKRQALKMNDLLFSAYLSSAAVSVRETLGRDLTLVDPVEGSEIHFEVISTPALNVRGERIGLVSVFRNVTDLRQANEELARNFAKLQQAEAEARRERDRLDLIIENVGRPVVVCDANGNFILFNRRAELLFQQEESAPPSFLSAIQSNSVKLTSFISGLASDATTGRQAEIELIDPQTSQPLPMEITSVEILDAKRQVTAVVSILHDLTEIRELERRRVEQQLFESEKLAAIGRLAASIAHEINNPLEAIKNSLFLLQTGQSETSSTAFLDIALKETERVSHIIRQMLGFARRAGGTEWVDVHQLLDETLVLIDKKLKQSGIKVTREFDADLPAVYARPDELKQVFLNLLLNAQQSIERDGRIRIRTARYRMGLQPSVSIEISDTGGGIRGEDLTRIFEPFFSTRKKGTGIGLWVTQDIVRHHGGRIEVTRSDPEGATFQIILPVESPALEKAGKE